MCGGDSWAPHVHLLPAQMGIRPRAVLKTVILFVAEETERCKGLRLTC